MLKPFCAETQIQIRHEIRASIEINSNMPEECFKNLKYRHTPSPNFLKEASGLVVLQQQKYPGVTMQQESLQEYF